eukprot:7376650-Prymnesium_polylepis.1
MSTRPAEDREDAQVERNPSPSKAAKKAGDAYPVKEADDDDELPRPQPPVKQTSSLLDDIMKFSAKSAQSLNSHPTLGCGSEPSTRTRRPAAANPVLGGWTPRLAGDERPGRDVRAIRGDGAALQPCPAQVAQPRNGFVRLPAVRHEQFEG